MANPGVAVAQVVHHLICYLEGWSFDPSHLYAGY